MGGREGDGREGEREGRREGEREGGREGLKGKKGKNRIRTNANNRINRNTKYI